MSDNDFDFFDLNEFDLVKEWTGQSKLMFQHCRMLADAEREAKQSDVELDLVEAELDRDIRTDPTGYGLEKVTEVGIKNALRLTKKWKKAKQKVIDAEHARDVYKGAVQALDHRKQSLSSLVNLQGQGYYSEPKAPNLETKNTIKNEDADRVINRMNKALNKKD